MAENNRYRKHKNQPIIEIDPNSTQIPSIIESTRCKSTISSLVISSNPSESNNNSKKKNFTSATFRGLGCAASPQVSVPAVIRTSANWEAKKVRKKKQRSFQQRKNKGSFQAVAMVHGNPSASSSTCVVDPDVWCGPGIGFATDATASVDCVVSRKCWTDCNSGQSTVVQCVFWGTIWVVIMCVILTILAWIMFFSVRSF